MMDAAPPPPSGVRRVVLTGGPGAGKTQIALALATRRPDRFMYVPEAATQVYHALNARWDHLDPAGRREVQRSIYALQREQEQRSDGDHAGRVLLLDRGTVDGSAYWPDGAEDYWRVLGTTAAAEWGRYEAVIWLESCAAVGKYDDSFRGSVRHESAEAAVATGRRVLEAWSAHPRLYRVAARETFEEKLAAVADLLGTLLTGTARTAETAGAEPF